MSGTWFLFILTLLLVLLGLAEIVMHRRNLAKIPIRIHINGTRGKSSVTRLIAAAFREAGMVTCAKTTGTLARMILPDGREFPVYRPAKANVIEQIRIVSTAKAFKAKVLVIECMALQPHLQVLSEFKFIQATHGVITNARPDHLDVMGPKERDVACALAGMVPFGGKLYTAERKNADVFMEAAKERNSCFVQVNEEQELGVSDDELNRFGHVEHRENVALALEVCTDLGVDRNTALRGMWKAAPDPGAMTEYEIDFFSRRLVFVNGFAANDPQSTEQVWKMAITRWPQYERKIAVFNCRADRPDRSIQLGRACVKWDRADHYVLIGNGTYLFARAAVGQGLDSAKILFAEDCPMSETVELIIGLAHSGALVMGMGNIGGPGLQMVRYFKNRSILPQRTEEVQ